MRSTNVIEAISWRTRHLGHTVKRWQEAEMGPSWATPALVHAEEEFRRIVGYTAMAGRVRAIGKEKKRIVA